MRTTTRRATAALLAGAVLLLGACGGDDGDDDAAATTTTEAEADAAPTTGADDEAATSTAGDEPDDPTTTTAEPGDDATTTAPDTSDEPGPGEGAPDEEAPDVAWDLDASQYRGQDGRRIAFLCPPDGDPTQSVWGTDTYTDDSSVCAAAVHQGLINTVEGGRVIIEIAPGEESYEGSEANGVTSQDYAAWSGSFTFLPA